MAELTTLVCDGCGKQRASDSNHWRVFVIAEPRKDVTGVMCFELVFWQFAQTQGGIGTDTAIAHVCGDKCATDIFSRWLSTGTLESGKAEVKS